MRYPPRFLDALRSRLSLSSVIGKRVKVTRAGREFKACCPFHKEKTPSFTINDDKQFYHCFGCGAHGDVIKFVMDHDNLSFNDAIEMLAGEAGLEVPKPDPRMVQQEKRSRGLNELMATAAQYFSSCLYARENEAIQRYLLDRGLSEKEVKDFQIGFAPEDGSALISVLTQAGFSIHDIIQVGLAKAGQNGRSPYAFFRERVMFPVLDRQKRVIAFGGRALPEEMRAPSRSDFKPPKYLNSPDTPLFDKSRVLYGEDKARLAAREGKPVIVTEGYMDVIACHQAGFSGAVAPMGTALTEGQIESLWMMIPADVKTPILCFDGDRAGQQAAQRALDRFLPILRPGQSAAFAFLPDGEDPDSLIKKAGAQRFQMILDHAMPMIDFLWSLHIASKKTDTPETRAGAIQSLKNAISTIEDNAVQSHYRSLIDARIKETFFNRDKQRGGRNGAAPPLQKPKMVLYNDLYERILLAALINHPLLFDYVEEQVAALMFQNPAYARLKQALIAELSQQQDLESFDGPAYLEAQGFVQERRDILDNSLYVHASFAAPVSDSGEIDLQNLANQWLTLWQDVQNKHGHMESQKAKKQEIMTGFDTK